MEEYIVSPPVAPIPPVPSQPQKKSKLLRIIILLIVILLVCVGLVYAGMLLGRKNITPDSLLNKGTPQVTTETITPKPTEAIGPAANWKTYRNEKYYFQYPPEAEAKSTNDKNMVNSQFNSSISTDLFKANVNLNLEGFGLECYKPSVRKVEVFDIINKTVKEIRVNDGFNDEVCGDNSSNTMLITGGEYNGDKYTIFINYKVNDENLAIKQLNQILSTFRFD